MPEGYANKLRQHGENGYINFIRCDVSKIFIMYFIGDGIYVFLTLREIFVAKSELIFLRRIFI